MTLDPLAFEYPIIVRPDRCTDGTFCYVAEHPDLVGCAAHGDTITEAKELLSHAREAYLKHLIAQGYPIPMPSQYRAAEWQSVMVNTALPKDDSELVAA